MKTISRLLILAALATVFALPAFAQDPAASPAGVCDEPAKGERYTEFYNLKKTNKPDDQAKAYELGKQYITKYSSCDDQYTTAVKNWVGKYEAALGSVNRRSDFFNAYNAKDVTKTNSLAQQLLAADQNDAAVALLTAWGIYQGTLTKNPAATESDALNYATKAFDLIQSGQEPKDLGGKVSWAPFANKEDALSYLNFEIGALELKSNPDDALKRLVAVAQGNGKAKEEASGYGYLAFLYEKQAAPLLDKYKTFTTKTPESDLVLANFNRVIDQVIDAYARGVAYSKDPKQKADFMSRLTDLYKSRHENSDAGLNEYVAGIKNTPFTVTEPLTSLPATPATTEGATTTNGTTSTPTAAPVAQPVAPKPAAVTTTTTTKTTTTPAKTPAPSKKPPVSRHH
jgi:hypothetical protein